MKLLRPFLGNGLHSTRSVDSFQAMTSLRDLVRGREGEYPILSKVFYITSAAHPLDRRGLLAAPGAYLDQFGANDAILPLSSQAIPQLGQVLMQTSDHHAAFVVGWPLSTWRDEGRPRALLRAVISHARD